MGLFATPSSGLREAMRTPQVWLGLLALGLGIVLYYPLFFPVNPRPLVAQSEHFFFEANSSAGLPVLVLSFWLFVRRGHYLDVLRGPGAVGIAAVVLTLSCALFAWGTYTGAGDLQLASVISSLIGVVLILGGVTALKAFWLPILFLGFSLPISPVLIAATIYPIQLETAQFAGLLLNVIGHETLVQGDQLIRPEATFIVIESCSGVRTIVTLSMLTVLLLDLFERRGFHAFLLLLCAPIVSFLVNGIRVVTLVLNPASSIHAIHNLQGIAMLLVGLITIYLIDGLLERALGESSSDEGESDYGFEHTNGSSRAKHVLAWIAVSSILIMMIGIERFGPRWDQASTRANRLEESPQALLERVFGEDPSAPHPIDYNFIGSVHYLAEARHRVEVDGQIVEIHLGVADEQLREYSILTSRLAWPASGYAVMEEGFVDIVEGGPSARRMVFRRGARSLLSYSWITRREDLALEWLRQAVALDRSPFVRPAHMLAIRLVTSLGSNNPANHQKGSLEAAEERIRRVWTSLSPELKGYGRIQ